MSLKTQIKARLFNLAVAFDQFAFCLATLGSSQPDETASSAAWRMELQGRWQGRVARPFIDWLFAPVEANHCRNAYRAEQAGEHLPEDQRGGPTKPQTYFTGDPTP